MYVRTSSEKFGETSGVGTAGMLGKGFFSLWQLAGVDVVGA